MTISITNLTVDNSAAAGTTVGILTAQDAAGAIIPCNFRLTKNSAGFFGISGNALVTAWSGPVLTGNYSVRVHAVGTISRFSGSAMFTIGVKAPAAPPPPPPASPPPPPPPASPPPPAPITVNNSVGPITVSPNAALTVAINDGPGNPRDWVAIAAVGAPVTSYMDWKYLANDSQSPPANGAAMATVHLAGPATGGMFEARFFSDDGFVLVTTSAPVTVVPMQSPPPPPPPPPGSGTIGYTATVAMDTGATYAYNPDLPGVNQTATDEGNFVSPFAGFVQRSIHCKRTDTALRLYFRKDVSPDAGRIEVILELGHLTSDGSAANLGPFTLQIFQGPTKVYTGRFPSMGWFTRWRWNPTPRPEVRTRTSLLPSDLNLVPNLSQSLATTFRAADCGTAASASYPVIAYSSNYDGGGPDTNPVGVNENCGLASNTGGVGGRPELGIVTEWQANYLVNGNAAAQQAMYVLAEVAGGMPWIVRDQATGAPADLIANPSYSWGGIGFDTPTVHVPSGGGTGTWILELNHLPSLSYVPYILTGDPFYLENTQFAANWTVGCNAYHRANGWSQNLADPNSPTIPGINLMFPSFRVQTRGLGWTIRDWSQAYLATPSSVPSWLLPKSYWSQGLSDNAAYADTYGTNYTANYPMLSAMGTMPAASDSEEGFYLSYLMLSLGFAVNQAGRSEWLPYFRYSGKMPIALSSGTSGWDPRWPSPYSLPLAAASTDYEASPAAITSFNDAWQYLIRSGANAPGNWTTTDGSNSFVPYFSAWTPNTHYVCNSWIFECRAGIPTLPNVGDVVSIKLGGFSGGPVTLSHTVTGGDIAVLAGYTTGSAAPAYAHPIIDDLVTKINASSTLSGKGITASYAPTVSTGYWHNGQATGRMYVNFDSNTVNPLTVTGSFTTSTVCSVFIEPNGDGVRNGSASAALWNRWLSYKCSKTGTSAASGGPTGAAFQTYVADGSAAWCFTPEFKSFPLYTPGVGNAAPFPRLLQDFTNPQPGYLTWAWAAMNVMVTAGIAGAPGALTNLRAVMDDYYVNVDPNYRNQFNFSIAP